MEDHKYDKQDKLNMHGFIGVLILFAILVTVGFTKQSKQTYQLNDTILYKELVKIGVKFPDIVVAQAKLETGNFKSNYCNERYNLFGFRVKGSYISFKSWKHCCQYYKQWQDKHYRYGKSYYQFLIDIKYAEDVDYIKKLKECQRKQ